MMSLDAVARRYGVRPSTILGILDEFQAFSVDYWAAKWSIEQERVDRALAEIEAGR